MRICGRKFGSRKFKIDAIDKMVLKDMIVVVLIGLFVTACALWAMSGMIARFVWCMG